MRNNFINETHKQPVNCKKIIFLFGLLLSVLHGFANENDNEEGMGGIKGTVYTLDKLSAAMVTVTIKGKKKYHHR